MQLWRHYKKTKRHLLVFKCRVGEPGAPIDNFANRPTNISIRTYRTFEYYYYPEWRLMFLDISNSGVILYVAYFFFIWRWLRPCINIFICNIFVFIHFTGWDIWNIYVALVLYRCIVTMSTFIALQTVLFWYGRQFYCSNDLLWVQPKPKRKALFFFRPR